MTDIRNLIGKGNNKVKRINPPITNQLPKNIENLPEIYCPYCNSTEFVSVMKMKYMSKIASPNGMEGTVNMTIQVCKNCSKPFNLNEWKKVYEEKTIIIPSTNKEQ